MLEAAIKNQTKTDRLNSTAELYKVRAQVVEAELHLKRIASEKSQRKAQNKQQALPPATPILRERASTTSALPTPPAVIPPSSKSPVEPGEALLIEVQADSASNRRVVVSADYTISHPFARDISVKGMTVQKVSELLEREFAKFYDKPEIFVVRENASTPMKRK